MWRNQKNGVVGKVKLLKKGILCYSQTDRRPEKIQPLSITQKIDTITGKWPYGATPILPMVQLPSKFLQVPIAACTNM